MARSSPDSTYPGHHLHINSSTSPLFLLVHAVDCSLVHANSSFLADHLRPHGSPTCLTTYATRHADSLGRRVSAIPALTSKGPGRSGGEPGCLPYINTLVLGCGSSASQRVPPHSAHTPRPRLRTAAYIRPAPRPPLKCIPTQTHPRFCSHMRTPHAGRKRVESPHRGGRSLPAVWRSDAPATLPIRCGAKAAILFDATATVPGQYNQNLHMYFIYIQDGFHMRFRCMTAGACLGNSVPTASRLLRCVATRVVLPPVPPSQSTPRVHTSISARYVIASRLPVPLITANHSIAAPIFPRQAGIEWNGRTAFPRTTTIQQQLLCPIPSPGDPPAPLRQFR